MRRILALLTVWLVVAPALGAASSEELQEMMESGRFAEAAEAAAGTLAELESDGETESVPYLDALRYRADALARSGHAADPGTTDTVRRMLELGGRLDLDPKRESEVFRTAGMVAWRAGDLVLSKRHTEKALAVAVAGLPAGDPTVAQLQGNLSILLRRTGDLDGARDHGEKAAAVCDVEPFRNCYTVYLALAQTYRKLGDLDAAADRYEKAVSEAERVLPPGHAHIPTVRHGLTLVETERGRYDIARDELEVVADELRAALGDEHPRLADALFSLGQAYRYLGDLERAEKIQRDVLAIRIATLKPGAETTGYSHSELGLVLDRLGRDDDACDQRRLALAIFEAQFEPGSAELASAEMAVANCEIAEHRPDAARARIERWTAMPAETEAGVDPVLSRVWATAARLATADGRYADAVTNYERAVAVLESTRGPDHPSLVGPLGGLARAYWRTGKTDDALRVALRAESLVQRFDRGNLAGLTDAESRAFVATLARTDWVPLSGLVHVDGKPGPWIAASWDWVLGRRGMIFDNEALRRRMVRGSDELTAAWSDVVRTRERLAAQWVAIGERPDPVRDEAMVAAALEARDAAERRLATMSRAFRERISSSRVTRDDVTAALPTDHALVEIVRVDVRKPGTDDTARVDIALVLLPGGTMRHAVLGSSEENDRAVAAWRSALASSYGSNDDAGARSAGIELRRRAWDPIADAVGDVGTVLLVPEAGLHQVPFAALPTDDGRFLIEAGPRVHILGSSRDTVRFAQARADTDASGLLVLADPAYGGGAGGDGKRAPSPCLASTARESLPASALEARRIDDLYRETEAVVVLQGGEADEAALREGASGRRILHLATHGYFVPASCDAEGGSIEVPPLLRSGLVVARGAGSDGILTAEEISVLDLDGTELVVLSACDTGLGEIAIGEGVYGLRRAFGLAGADTVVMSLWSVPDRQALKWMTAFYGRLIERVDPGVAAHEASLELLAELRERRRDAHPWMWAGFITAGDWR